MDLYAEALRLPRQLRTSRPHPVTYRDLRHRGLSREAVQWRASRQRLLRPHHGVYLERPDLPNLLDRARAALRAAPPLAVLGAHTAAQLYGFGVAQTNTIHLLMPAGTPFPQRPGITAHQVTLPIGPSVELFDLPCAPPTRCAVDLARILSRRCPAGAGRRALFRRLRSGATVAGSAPPPGPARRTAGPRPGPVGGPSPGVSTGESTPPGPARRQTPATLSPSCPYSTSAVTSGIGLISATPST